MDREARIKMLEEEFKDLQEKAFEKWTDLEIELVAYCYENRLPLPEELQEKDKETKESREYKILAAVNKYIAEKGMEHLFN